MNVKSLSVLFVLAAVTAQAKVYTTTSNGGIGDVDSLTNAFAQAKGNFDEVAIAPGVYDLTGVKMDAENHLRLGGTGNPVQRKVYGLGATRDETVLVGGGEADGVRVLNVWGGGCSVSNLTVTGGYSQGTGGGLYSQETCSDCIISNNYARNGGGGIHCAKVFCCLIADNRTSNGYGGGLYLGNSTDCVISNNVTTKSDSNLGAGGAYSGTHTRTKFLYNRAPSAPGGACNSGTFIGCDFVGNSAYRGGAVSSGSVVSNCLFSGNSASNGTSALAGSGTAYGCRFINSSCNQVVVSGYNLIDCVVSNNVQTSGNIHILGISGKVLRNCLLADNRNTGAANGGYAGTLGEGARLENCTVIGFWRQYSNYSPVNGNCVCVNTLFYGNGPYDIVGNAAPTMTNCLWKTQYGTLTAGKATDCQEKKDPRFLDAANANYTFGVRSPACDAGSTNEAVVASLGPADLNGDPRVMFERVDIGCFECQKAVTAVFRAQAKDGVGDVDSLTNALTRAEGNFDEVTIEVEPGRYDVSGVKMETGSHLKVGAADDPVPRRILGLGAMPGETVLVGGGEAVKCRVLRAYGTDIVVSNVTATGGWTTGTAGGIYADGPCRNCIVTNNVAKGNGGGLRCSTAYGCLIAFNRSTGGYGGGLCSTHTVDCTVLSNVVEKSDINLGGGGAYEGHHLRTKFLYNRATKAPGGGLDTYSQASATDCEFIGNYASEHGGAASDKVALTNCLISVCRPGGTGNALWGCTMASRCRIINSTNGNSIVYRTPMEGCIFSNNVQTSGNGTMISGNSTKLVNCLFVNNRNTGAVNGGYTGTLAESCVLFNCDVIGFWRQYSYRSPLNASCVCVNTVISGNYPYDAYGNTVPTMTNCLWTTQSGTVPAEKAVNCLAKKDPKFRDAANGDYSFARRTPLFNKGYQDDDYLAAVGPVDLNGNPRIYEGDGPEKAIIDIGCYECQLPAPGMLLVVR